MYLVLTVSMRGSQRLLKILPLLEKHRRGLPYKIANRSDLLVAFRQHGCAHWDLLGMGESADYIWDDPSGTRALQVHACDAAGIYSGTSDADAYKLQRQTNQNAQICV